VTEPHHWAEIENPTEEVIVELGNGKRITRHIARRRSSEKQVMDALEARDLLAYAVLLRRGWEALTGGTVKAQDYGREHRNSCKSMTPSQLHAYMEYSLWHDRCKNYPDINTGPLYHVWFEGGGMKEAARKFKIRDGRVIELMVEALTV